MVGIKKGSSSKFNKIVELSPIDVPLAPIFYPTEEEFADCYGYLRKIRPVAEPYGIIKIVPPASWKVPFSIDPTKKFIKTRIQQLSEVEAETRMKKTFNENVAALMDILGVDTVLPELTDDQEYDVYEFYKLVAEKYKKKCENTKKKVVQEVCKKLKINANKHNVNQLISLLNDIILPYMEISKLSTPISQQENENDENSKNKNTKRKRTLKKSNECGKCRQEIVTRTVLKECHQCEGVFHSECVEKYLTKNKNFTCKDCVVEKFSTQYYDNSYYFVHKTDFKGDDYLYSLNEFKKKADKFKSNYFARFKNVNLKEEDFVERHFWWNVLSPKKRLAVEYGADLNVSDYTTNQTFHTEEEIQKNMNSGFPIGLSSPCINNNKVEVSPKTKNTQVKNNYWNLNNFPFHPECLMSKLINNKRISGMTVPWVYVGMMFSCFCWHVEDHWSCSINFNHTGAIKTWYGIPSSACEKFESFVKEQYKEIFKDVPSLFHQLNTTFNVEKIQKQGDIPVYKVNQQAGEYVVTFYRSYHSGFNQGFNVAEAVNFSFEDFLRVNRNAVLQYKVDCRLPVLNHEKITLRYAKQFADRKKTLYHSQLASELDFILEQIKLNDEAAARIKCRKMQRRQGEKVKNCGRCLQYCSYGAVHCSNHDKEEESAACLEHFEEVCKCAPGSRELVLESYFSEEEVARLIETCRRQIV